ncbi:MAG: GLPGLI family protein [Muribaculaceae bacterium]|nr:GLPGLI family protein [Muribaculaceae bacterium]
MKKMLTPIVVGFVALASSAQTADIEVSYTAMSPNFKNGNVDVKNQYILLAGAAESKFFSPITEYIDSLNSTPEGVAKYREMSRSAALKGDWDNVPRRDGSYYVLKSIGSNTLKYYDISGVDKYFYEDRIDDLNWEVSDSTKIILGYECIKASADFHGRKWNAWFSPEIPVANGPWKLGGLPGLILEASTDDANYSFMATGIQQSAKPIGAIYLADEYEKTDRIKYLKAKRAFIDNPIGSLNAQFGEKIKITSNNPVFQASDKVDLIETDYR